MTTYYRLSIWFLKGLNEYTRGGFATAQRKFNELDLQVNCQGKAFMITGANSGIGKQTALEIAKKGGTIHMVCRNPQSAQEAKEEIVKESNNDNVHIHILDLSQPKSVMEFAKNFREKQERLDCLVNNAGCMVNNRELLYV